ncbi:low molecular weight protein-tyrosine-phosphatase [Marinicrinis lubricantis]|uniref:protein-tyrosine-phosphatase n=1 Tax=Marinicrinis lubricantis TaxID=2086470 RepID=A0ABW1ILW2_9BACL
MIRVLFVCLGNICRSPMAEAVMRHKVKEAGLEHAVTVDSAGTGDWHIGKPPHAGTRNILDQNKVPYDGIRARQVTAMDADRFDYIIAMDTQNAKDISRIFGGQRAHVIRLLDLLVEETSKDVPDPYYTGNFELVYRLIDDACDRLLSKIRQDHQL